MTTIRPTFDPARAGVDPSALESLRARIAVEQDAGRMPAAQFALAVDGELALVESFGTATDSTRFSVFSCTKALIAGVVWQLIAEGTLATDTRAIELLPGFGADGRTPEWMARVTLEQLLTHASGFPAAPLGPPRWDTRESRLEVFTRWHASFEPGTYFQYHPTAAHWVVAEMIAAVEGRDHRDVVRARIIEPLGLNDMAFGPAEDDQDDIAELVVVGGPPTREEIEAVFGTGGFDIGEVTPDALLMFNDTSVRRVGVPGAGAVSTAAALAMYYQALLHNPDGLWDPAVLADGTGHIRCTLPNPDLGFPANRTLGLIVAGDDGLARFRGMGATTSPLAFGHNGAAGQIAWADPATGVSFVLTTSGIDGNFLREARRIVSLASKGGLLVPFRP
jgi:CubicO group peptidase (beta-lactamase class C family)